MLHGAPTLLMRALREDANRRRPHYFRLGGTALIFLFLIVAHASSGGISAPGRRFFELISFLNLALIVLAGSSYFATAITEEKEQGTLGLLHLAGVSPIGLLLGKSTSRLISVLLVFLGQLPFALLAITLGGITVRQIIAVDIALAAFLVMVANLGLLCSVIAKRSGSACAWVLLGLSALLLGVHYGDDSLTLLVQRRFLSADSRFISMSRDILSWLEEVSIVTRIQEVLETGFNGSLAGEQVWWHLSVGVGAFMLSWLAFDRFTRYSDVTAPSRGWLPLRKSRWKLLVGRPWKWPFVWKDYHFITGGHSLALLKLAIYPVVLVLMWWSQEALQVMTGLPFPTLSRRVILAIIAGELTLSASRIFHEELKWGTLPSVASLPQPVIAIAYGKLLGCLLGIIPAVMVLCVLVMVVPTSARPAGAWDHLGWWLLGMEFVVLLHLTALLSLVVKWGALALAVATLLVINALLALPFSLVAASLVATFDDESSLIPSIIYLGFAMCAVLQVLIAISLRAAAAR